MSPRNHGVGMDSLLTSQTTLLLAMGMSAYVGLLHLWYTRRWSDPHLWVGLWSAAAVASQAGRLVQLHTDDPGVAVVMARCYAGMAPLLIASLCGFARSLSGRPTSRLRRVAFAVANLALSLAIVGTDWFVTGETRMRHDWFGASYIGVHGRPSMLVLPSYMTWACVWVLRELHRSGSTICMVTHDARFARHADRTIHLFDGRVVEDTVSEAAGVA